ncbi:MAG: S-layer homology domain-containing protein [Candidatus Abawacabacteria bacterium]|nr:S-layer homology domain-containing protein [Candidatus Abawacabacteria bacterium]
MKNSLGPLLLGIIFLSNTFAQSLEAASFNDVPATDPDIAAYNFVSDQGIMTGAEDGKFHPELGLTRCELVKIALLASNARLNTDSSASFPDITATHWCHRYAKTALSLRIISGYPDGKFRPNQKVTQIEALKILINSANAILPQVTSIRYSDVAISDWWAPYIQYAQDTIFSAQPLYIRESRNYGINREMYRAETAYIVWKLFAQSVGTTMLQYQNTDLAIALNYPQGWQVSRSPYETTAIMIEFISPQSIQRANNLEPHQMECYTCGPDFVASYYASFAEFKESFNSVSSATSVRGVLESIESMSVIGERALSGSNGSVSALEVIQDVAFPMYTLFAEKNGHVYIFTFAYAENRADLNILESQILDSIRFL